jgi:malto-oligosyltrehalose synthase/4-alpha-glucanotransferase
MFNPRATYRIQFHKEFNFKSFEAIIPYLKKLGINTIYASPVFKAAPGSTHGYDVTDPQQINPEAGTLNELINISDKLKKEKISWLQDIVPNHMAFDSNNLWLMDVLEKGPQSNYLPFFDITWTSPLYSGRVMVPFLGAPPDEIINNKELKVDHYNDRLVFKYYENYYPLHLRSYNTVLKSSPEEPEGIKQLKEQVPDILQIEDPLAYSEQMEEFKKQFFSLLKDKTSGAFIKNCIKMINGSSESIKEIAEEQVYQLCHWQETNHQINFRRFFTINGLICLNIQHPKVFAEYHKLINELLQKDIFQGLRVDHVDGMYDPTAYLQQLRALAGEDTYIIVEKILEPEENIPEEWPVQGNTGYDFLSIVNNLFFNNDSRKQLIKFYRKLINDDTSVKEHILEKKSAILYNRLAGELDNMTQLFLELNLTDDADPEKVPPKDIKSAIAEFLIRCPVYRYYGNQMPLENEEAMAVQSLINSIRNDKQELSGALNLLEKTFLQKPQNGDVDYNERAVHFYKRCMQFTGPLMAKGVEDTLMYVYNYFIGHNEVGSSPDPSKLTVKKFHNKMRERQEKWPLSLNATATHDTKRGEDVRMRLNVLSEIPEEWRVHVQEWRQMNEGLQKNNVPDNNDEYFIYQTLFGAWPMPGEDDGDFSERIQEYLIKALREAKKHSNWTEPDKKYEEGSKSFVVHLLNENSPFRKSFKKFYKKVVDYGIVNSLAQVLLKFTSPGVPDLYQGSELWDLSLVDPDNRRPVDYELRNKYLKEITAQDGQYDEEFLSSLWEKRYTGQIKLWLTYILLNERQQQKELFREGDYIPLKIKGKFKKHILAFCRSDKNATYVVIIPLHIASLARQQKRPVTDLDWKDTAVILPEGSPVKSQHLLAGRMQINKGKIKVEDAFNPLPLGLIKMVRPLSEKRGAGILLHITSLPSRFGVGDLGKHAYKFAEFLERSGQSYWQLLPLNPTEAESSHSPYSSHSSMAGNTLLINPEMLVKNELLEDKDIDGYTTIASSHQVDFKKAEEIKKELFEKAYKNYISKQGAELHHQFNRFCEEEAFWLDDFALYVMLKQKHAEKAWFEWPDEHKYHNKDALQALSENQSAILNKVKWLQFIFFRQWGELKKYCNSRNIMLFGDLPFYISHDSVDVWSHPEIFRIDENGKVTGIAGVPPDYFNENGQLWGMPVFNWKVLKKQKYKWWVQRIRKNIQLYDLLRLDHFRAFSDFWVVPAGEETAVNGTWEEGPGARLFKVLKKELGELPFIAEDLGDINDDVYKLRDKFNFPGMKVLQFAFGDDISESPHILHNYTSNHIAYTGTHDNNTSLGWFRKDTGKTEHKHLEEYSGMKINEKNVHKVLCRMAYSSVAKVAIIPMQDILGLDEKSRMNLPASTEKNWLWQMEPQSLSSPSIEKWLSKWVRIYNRK